MYSYFINFFLVTFYALAALALPQGGGGGSSSLLNIPTCAGPCIQALNGSSCAVSDVACLCKQPGYVDGFEACILNGCTNAADIIQGLAEAFGGCGAVGASATGTSVSSQASAAYASATSAGGTTAASSGSSISSSASALASSISSVDNNQTSSSISDQSASLSAAASAASATLSSISARLSSSLSSQSSALSSATSAAATSHHANDAGTLPRGTGMAMLLMALTVVAGGAVLLA